MSVPRLPFASVALIAMVNVPLAGKFVHVPVVEVQIDGSQPMVPLVERVTGAPPFTFVAVHVVVVGPVAPAARTMRPTKRIELTPEVSILTGTPGAGALDTHEPPDVHQSTRVMCGPGVGAVTLTITVAASPDSEILPPGKAEFGVS